MSPRLGDVLLTAQSDERLVWLTRAGHERAFGVIVERYRPELSALARRLSSDGTGEDIVQQALLSAFEALRSGTEVKHLRGWLYRIVRNAAARSGAPICVPLAPDGAPAGGATVEDVVEQRALARDALTELARLPKRQRQAMVGTALDGRARVEVAMSMGLTEGAVRQLVHRARARLRTAMSAVIPWPLARWFAAGAGTGNGAELAAGAGAGVAGGGGFLGLKLGVVLASGAIATGVGAVDLSGHGAPARHRAVARAAPPRSVRERPRRLQPRPGAVAGVPVARVSPSAGRVSTGDDERSTERHHRDGGSRGKGGNPETSGRGAGPSDGGGGSGPSGDGSDGSGPSGGSGSGSGSGGSGGGPGGSGGGSGAGDRSSGG
jgi:RNA polymerase sigma factor (sigma-70 family)